MKPNILIVGHHLFMNTKLLAGKNFKIEDMRKALILTVYDKETVTALAGLAEPANRDAILAQLELAESDGRIVYGSEHPQKLDELLQLHGLKPLELKVGAGYEAIERRMKAVGLHNFTVIS